MPKATQAAKNRRTARRNTATVNDTATATTTRSTAKTKTVKLKGYSETTNTWQFRYAGTAAEPFVKAVYITKDALDTLSDGPLTVVFGKYVPGPKQKPMPASAIRYSGNAETIRDLYVNRAQAEKIGMTNDTPVKVSVKVVSDDEISLTISAA
jgi:hypothetical protein